MLMDVEMPVMGGITACRAIKARANDPPWLVALTTNAITGDREHQLDTGFDGYLAKPIDHGGLPARATGARYCR